MLDDAADWPIYCGEFRKEIQSFLVIPSMQSIDCAIKITRMIHKLPQTIERNFCEHFHGDHTVQIN